MVFQGKSMGFTGMLVKKLLIDSSHNVDIAAYVASEGNGVKEMAYSDT